jgi:hypothetical protein
MGAKSPEGEFLSNDREIMHYFPAITGKYVYPPENVQLPYTFGNPPYVFGTV